MAEGKANVNQWVQQAKQSEDWQKVKQNWQQFKEVKLTFVEKNLIDAANLMIERQNWRFNRNLEFFVKKNVGDLRDL